jgi:uncharacterized membrane protein YgcG
VTSPWRVGVLVAILLAPAAACSDKGPGEGEARLEVNGKANVERADGKRETIDGGTDLASGDRVTMVEGIAMMQLRGGTTFELRQGFDDAAPTAVLMAKRPVLEAGDLLVATPDSTTVEADGTKVKVTEGAARLTRAFGMSVVAYDADLALDSAGVLAEVPALRQMVVPDLGRPPRAPRPVEPNLEDNWDQRYLGAAMVLDKELQVMADQLTGLLPEGEGRTVGFLKDVLPSLEDEPGLAQGLIDLDRDPGDTLVGAAITDLGKRGDFTDRWGAVFDFRDEGAAWGIVALDQAVRSAPLVGSVEQAFNASFDDIAQGPDTASSPGGGGSNGSDGGSDGTGSGGTDGSSGDGGGSQTPSGPTAPLTPPVTPPTTTPLPPPTAPEPPPELAPVVEPVADLVDELLGGLLG